MELMNRSDKWSTSHVKPFNSICFGNTLRGAPTITQRSGVLIFIEKKVEPLSSGNTFWNGCFVALDGKWVNWLQVKLNGLPKYNELVLILIGNTIHILSLKCINWLIVPIAHAINRNCYFFVISRHRKCSSNYVRIWHGKTLFFPFDWVRISETMWGYKLIAIEYF